MSIYAPPADFLVFFGLYAKSRILFFCFSAFFYTGAQSIPIFFFLFYSPLRDIT